MVRSKMKTTEKTPKLRWGRNPDPSTLTALISAGIVIFSPIVVLYFWLTCDSFNGSMKSSTSFIVNVVRDFFTNRKSAISSLAKTLPRPTVRGLKVYSSYIALQALMYIFIPGKTSYSQSTPSGLVLPYKTNGYAVWILTVTLFIFAAANGIIDPEIISSEWGSILIWANVLGFASSIFAYIKAYKFPTYLKDTYITKSKIYNFYMGIELNPRITDSFDLKLFFNSRVGMILWTLVNMSFMATQYRYFGHVSNSLICVSILQNIYIADLFYNEDWYLKTIDICHDHFGYYFAWGSAVWLPFMYTLQGFYLSKNPVVLSNIQLLLITLLGMMGYIIFRCANNQKYIIRENRDSLDPEWLKKNVIIARYKVGNKVCESILLCSEWWGLARHMNYTGDLILSLATCMACGTKHLLPYTYSIYMFILLLHRTERSSKRCSLKYGEYWGEYCKRVPQKLIPYVY